MTGPSADCPYPGPRRSPHTAEFLNPTRLRVEQLRAVVVQQRDLGALAVDVHADANPMRASSPERVTSRGAYDSVEQGLEARPA